VLVIVM
jgi:hypothetical protein